VEVSATRKICFGRIHFEFIVTIDAFTHLIESFIWIASPTTPSSSLHIHLTFPLSFLFRFFSTLRIVSSSLLRRLSSISSISSTPLHFPLPILSSTTTHTMASVSSFPLMSAQQQEIEKTWYHAMIQIASAAAGGTEILLPSDLRSRLGDDGVAAIAQRCRYV
jgi:hypothetical protein